MMFTIGQQISIPCRIQGGAFTNEYLVSIEAEEGILSGFADEMDVKRDANDRERGWIRATVLDVAPGRVKVRLSGSFFTTASGMMQFSSNWASEHLQKRPADVISNAVHVMRIATGDVIEAHAEKDPAAVALGRRGGLARAKSLTKKERIAIAKKGAAARHK